MRIEMFYLSVIGWDFNVRLNLLQNLTNQPFEALKLLVLLSSIAKFLISF